MICSLNIMYISCTQHAASRVQGPQMVYAMLEIMKHYAVSFAFLHIFSFINYMLQIQPPWASASHPP